MGLSPFAHTPACRYPGMRTVHFRLLCAFAACAALLTLAVPAFADDDRDGPRHDRDDMAPRVTRLVNAINHEVTTLSNIKVDADTDSDVDIVDLDATRVLSLATLDSRFNADQANAINSAVNANSTALQSFLSNGSAQANAVDAALSEAGVSQSSVLAIIERANRLVVITSSS